MSSSFRAPGACVSVRASARVLGLAGFLLLSLLLLTPLAAAQDVMNTDFADLPGVEAIATDNVGNVYVAVPGRIWRIDAQTKARTVFAGTGVPGSGEDGGFAVSTPIGRVTGLAVNANDPNYYGPQEVFFVDHDANRIRKVDTMGIVRTVAGDGSATNSGDDGDATAAGLEAPLDIAFDSDHRLYVTAGNRIRAIRGGIITTVAGVDEAGYVDGAAADARFDSPHGLAIGSDDALMIADRGNRRLRLLFNGRTAVMSIAGNGGTGYAGQSGDPATIPLGDVSHVARLWDGDTVVLTLPGANRLVAIGSQSATLSPYAGTGTAGADGDGGAPASARLDAPAKVLQTKWGVHIADTGNGRLRRIGAPAAVPQQPPAPIATPYDEAAEVRLEPFLQDPPELGFEAIEIRSTPETHVMTIPREQIGGAWFRFQPLQNGTSYTFRVRHLYRDGIAGPWSPESNAVTPMPYVSGHVEDGVAVEGTGGTTTMAFAVHLWDSETVDVALQARPRGYTATEGVDFDATPIDFVIAAGSTSATVTVPIVADAVAEANERFVLEVFRPDGQALGEAGRGLIVDDDAGGSLPGFATRDDLFHAPENGDDQALAVIANDHVPDRFALVGGALSVTTSPQHGTIRVDDAGTADDAADDTLVYRPAPDWSGTEVIGYRLCTASGTCAEGIATVRVSMAVSAWIDDQVRRGTGYIRGARELSALRFAATPLVRAKVDRVTIAEDPDITSPWNDAGAGTLTRMITVPTVSNEPSRWRIAARVEGYKADLYVGIDDDMDGVASPDETRCVSAMDDGREYCDFALTHPGTGPVRYWVRVHNTSLDDVTYDLLPFAVPMIETDGSLVAVGPGRIEAGGTAMWQAAHMDSMLTDGDGALGFVRVLQSGVEVDIADVQVFDSPYYDATHGRLLVPGEPHTLALEAGAAADRLFIDVPVGATQLMVQTASEGAVDLYLASSTPPEDRAIIAAAPARGAAQASATGAGGSETIVLSGAQLTPGRWYVTPVNTGEQSTVATVTVTLTAIATATVRPGSYFNAARGGHGIFLYPAADQWAGLWYTYGAGGRTTWYYAQGAKPGADGIWRGGLYHSVWHGTGNLLTRIGTLTVTPTGDDRFVFTHEVHGVVGSQPMAALGRGCPVYGGSPVDSSGNWFDPRTAGTGYSVQLWEDYEYFAAFVYDERGEARFLAAESPNFAGGDATLVLEQLNGTPPTSTYLGPPVRYAVGTLRRVLQNGKLARIVVSAAYADDVPGHWSGDDQVELLGGPMATQGCQP